MPLSGATPLHLSSMILLLFSLLPPEGALSWVLERSSGLPGVRDTLPGPDTSRYREMRERYENLINQLRMNQSWEDSSPDPSANSLVWILTPEPRPGPSGHVHLRIPVAALSAVRSTDARLHRALLWLPPTAPSPRDVTRPLQRLLAREGPAPPTLRLRPSRQWDRVLAATPTARARLEVHLLPRASRGRRHTHTPTAEACVAGKAQCCRVQSRRVTLEELGWADWVMAPRQLDVRACVGACPPRFRSASAHARIKARLHKLDPRSSPGPCCVPSSFEPVVLMHKDSEGRVTLTPYDDILVKDCHCA